MAYMTRIAGAALGVTMLIGSGLSAPLAQAGYVVTIEQTDPTTVQAFGIGSIDLTGLMFSVRAAQPVAPIMQPNYPAFATGQLGVRNIFDNYQVFFPVITGPSSFGPGGVSKPTFSSGGSSFLFFYNNIFPDPTRNYFLIGVPPGYKSGDTLANTLVFLNQTYTTLGVNPGIYTWTWGTGPNQNFSLDILPPPITGPGPGPVPEPSALVLLGTALAGLFILRFRANRRDRHIRLQPPETA